MLVTPSSIIISSTEYNPNLVVILLLSVYVFETIAFDLMQTDFKELQFSKTELPRLVTFSGIVIEVRP